MISRPIENKNIIKYPCLMISNDRLIIVLMIDNEIGTVVYSNDDNYNIGYYDEDWDMEELEIYNGKLELSNE